MSAVGGKGQPAVSEPTREERAVARRAAESRATVPDLELAADVELTAVCALREQRSCSLLAILVRACALALRDVPRANSAYRDGNYELFPRVNVGVVMASGGHYTVPTVFDADVKPLAELDEELARLAERAGDGVLAPPELAGATFTVSLIERAGIDRATPLLVAPQAAALCAGAPRPAPVLRGGAIVPGQTMTITLACDHRILYGQAAEEFLAAVRARLEEARL